MTERFTMDDPNDWGFPITDNVTGKVYNCASNILMKELCVVVNTIAEENKQLKSVVKEVIELLSEEVDVFSDKATEHDINAYVELKELDNKDAYYMATATKKAIKLLKEVVDD